MVPLDSTQLEPVRTFDAELVAHIPRLRRYARALTRDVTRADDLVQSCLMRAIAKQHLWDPGTNLRAWLFTILHNQHVNIIRRAMREAAEGGDGGDAAAALPAKEDPAAGLLIRDLTRALAKLPPEQRRSLIMIAADGMTYEATAKIEKVPVGTIRSRLSRGREALRCLMDGGEIMDNDELDLLERWGRA